MSFQAEHLGFAYRLRDATFELPRSGFVAIAGPNGAGKSTLAEILTAARAQEPETLLLDEPATFLDLKHQLSIYHLLADLAKRGMLVVAVTHDLNLTLTYADHIVVLDGGRIAAQGAPREVLTTDLISRVFAVNAQIHAGPPGQPHIFFEAQP